MTPSILLTMFGNKVLVELKRKLQEIYTGKEWHPIKEDLKLLDNNLENTTKDNKYGVYKGVKDINKCAYYTNQEIPINTVICPMYVNNSVTEFGLHIKPHNNPNCQLVGNNLVTCQQINANDELTIPHEVYDKIHHGK